MSETKTVLWPFDDGVTGRSCALVIPRDGSVYPRAGQAKIGVWHADECPALADLAIELDAFYCTRCRYNGRVSGAWARHAIEISQGQPG